MVDRLERNKDLVQELVESTATHVGQIATIITGAVVGVAREVGEIFTDGFEMREAARKARLDGDDDQLPDEVEVATAPAPHTIHDPTTIDQEILDASLGEPYAVTGPMGDSASAHDDDVIEGEVES